MGIDGEETGVKTKRMTLFNTKRHKPTSIYEKGVYPDDFTDEFKASIRDRDNHRCAICSHKRKPEEPQLDVHHINFRKDTRRENCISLCRKCHTAVHTHSYDGWRRWWENRLGRLAMGREKKKKTNQTERRLIVKEMRRVIKVET